MMRDLNNKDLKATLMLQQMAPVQGFNAMVVLFVE